MNDETELLVYEKTQRQLSGAAAVAQLVVGVAVAYFSGNVFLGLLAGGVGLVPLFSYWQISENIEMLRKTEETP